MTRPDDKRPKPCAGCGGRKPIYTDGEEFFKWDPDTGLYRTVDYKGQFYPLATHPGCTEVQLVTFYQNAAPTVNYQKGQSALQVATEQDIMWRTLALLVDVLSGKRQL